MIPRLTPPKPTPAPTEPLKMEVSYVTDLEIVFSSGRMYVETLKANDILRKTKATIEIDFENGKKSVIQRKFVAYESQQTRGISKVVPMFAPSDDAPAIGKE
jgi:hypothetical protein